MRLSKYQLPIFFFLAFAITWTAQITAYLYAFPNGIILTNESNFLNLLNIGGLPSGFLPYLLLFSFSFGPTVAGIIVTYWFYGNKGLRGLLNQLLAFRLPGKWYLLAITIPVALVLASLLLGFVLSGFQSIQYEFYVPLSLFIPFFLYMTIFTGLAGDYSGIY